MVHSRYLRNSAVQSGPIRGTLGGMTPVACELWCTSKPLPSTRQPQRVLWREAQPDFSGDLCVSGPSCLSFSLQSGTLIRAPPCCGHSGGLVVHTEVPGDLLPGGRCWSYWLWCWHMPEARVLCVTHHPGGLFPPLLWVRTSRPCSRPTNTEAGSVARVEIL